MILTQPMLVHSESHFILNLKCKLQKIETRTNYRSYSTTLDELDYTTSQPDTQF